MKPGDRVGDGSGARGTVVRVEHPDHGPHAPYSVVEEIYVDWNIRGTEGPTDGAEAEPGAGA